MEYTHQLFQNRKHIMQACIACLVAVMVANVAIDYVLTKVQSTAFYLSESLLFSGYWVLFPPLIILLKTLAPRTAKIPMKLAVASVVFTLHLLAYPALIWILSKAFYGYTFSYGQTFVFGLSAYSLTTAIIYGFSLLAFGIQNKKVGTVSQPTTPATDEPVIRSIVLSEGNNQKVVVAITDILYFSANPPYVEVYLSTRKYLYAETLRTLEARLTNSQFVRIHKSHIVNLATVVSYHSRQNGDYDVLVSNGATLRVSRNYARVFKLKIGTLTRLASE